MSEIYDLVIVGGGPAGLTAAIYATRYQLKTLVLATVFGGTAAQAHKICNFPSYKSIKGFELMEKMRIHAQDSGAEMKMATVKRIEKKGEKFKILVGSEEYLAKTIVLALGMKHRQLGLSNESKYLGRGLSYCFTCDGSFFKNRVVAVVGGSNAAVTAVLYFAEICPKVYLIYRKNKLRAEPVWTNLLAKKKNVEIVYDTNVIGLSGESKLEKIKLDKNYQNKREIVTDGLFIEIGGEPTRKLIQLLAVEIDEQGFAKINSGGETNIQGVWAAGDMTVASDGFRQIITACAQGAVAAQSVFKYLQREKKK
ncbi:FAD-dependent oxidoreductase [Candidatus Shapirobacteria bacterium]|nr:FAD-dependent oxidoreductase [Candidatus Shapirobacteria bacterium]